MTPSAPVHHVKFNLSFESSVSSLPSYSEAVKPSSSIQICFAIDMSLSMDEKLEEKDQVRGDVRNLLLDIAKKFGTFRIRCVRRVLQRRERHQPPDQIA